MEVTDIKDNKVVLSRGPGQLEGQCVRSWGVSARLLTDDGYGHTVMRYFCMHFSHSSTSNLGRIYVVAPENALKLLN